MCGVASGSGCSSPEHCDCVWRLETAQRNNNNNNSNNNNNNNTYLETIPGQHSIDSPQKTAIIGTSHFIRKCYKLRLEA
jgi:hypothetical protein